MSITLSPGALRQVKALMGENDLDVSEHVVRISVEASSGGFDYALDIEDAASANDRKFSAEDVTIVVDPRSYLHLKGTKVDFEGSGFTFANPNA